MEKSCGDGKGSLRSLVFLQVNRDAVYLSLTRVETSNAFFLRAFYGIKQWSLLAQHISNFKLCSRVELQSEQLDTLVN